MVNEFRDRENDGLGYSSSMDNMITSVIMEDRKNVYTQK